MMMGVVEAWGGATYYYDVTARAQSNVSGNAGGKVYTKLTTSEINPDNFTTSHTQRYETTSEHYGYGSIFGIRFPVYRSCLYLNAYAKPDDGFEFINWTTDNNFIEMGATTSQYTTTNVKNTKVQNPNVHMWGDESKSYTLTANFKKVNGYIQDRVADGQTTLGTTTSSNRNSVTNGEIVTLNAIPTYEIAGVSFDHWERSIEGGAAQRFAGDTDATLKITNQLRNETYIAYFTQPAPVDGVYCRIKCKNGGKYLSIRGTEAYSRNSTNDQYFTSSAFELVSSTEAETSPSTVFYISGSDDGSQGFLYTNLESQGVALRSTIAKPDKDVKNPGDIHTEKIGNDYKFTISASFTNSGQTGTLPAYLTRSSDKDVRFAADNGNNSLWTIEILNEANITNKSVLGFGVKPLSSFTMDGLYYTTLYTTFPYKLADGENAYYLDWNPSKVSLENNTITLTKIPAGGEVPAYRAVVLECKKAGQLNTLIPVKGGASMQYNNNDIIRGSITLSESSQPATLPQGGYVEIDGNGYTTYVLSVVDNKLGFYSYEGNLNNNKAFAIVTDEYISLAKTAKIYFGEDRAEADGIEKPSIQLFDTEAIYDLQGRRVDHPTKGIYIKGGRKFILK